MAFKANVKLSGIYAIKIQKMRDRAGAIGLFCVLFILTLSVSCHKDNETEQIITAGSTKSVVTDSALNSPNRNSSPATGTTSPNNTTAPANNVASSSAFGPVRLSDRIILNGSHDIIIKGDSINGIGLACITLNNCYNIHITKCKLMNSLLQGVFMFNCVNIIVDSCFISNVSAGVYVHIGSRINVNANEFLNMNGPFPAGNFVQFNTVSGDGNSVNYNNCEDIFGAGIDPNPGGGDGISLYRSSGTAASPIQVYGNWIRGGGTSTGSQGMAGIVVGDAGGTYQDVENNILVNTGYVGIQQQGGSNMTIINNYIYSADLPWSGGGLISANYAGTASTNNTISGNKINWIAGYLGGARRDTAWKPGNSNARPINWNTNTTRAPIDETLLPTAIITWN